MYVTNDECANSITVCLESGSKWLVCSQLLYEQTSGTKLTKPAHVVLLNLEATRLLQSWSGSILASLGVLSCFTLYVYTYQAVKQLS